MNRFYGLSSNFLAARSMAPKLCLCFAVAVFVFASSPSKTLAAQAVPMGVIDSLTNLSSEERDKLLREYGVTQPDTDSPAESDGVGEPGTPLEPIETPIDDTTTSKSLGSRELERYGMHVFDKDVSTFAPVDNAPVPEGYLLGPGDSVNISLYGKEPSRQTLKIDREGTISFPRIGSITLAGLKFGEAKQLIEESVERQMIGNDVAVSMGRLRSINVFMAGEVRAPGNYSVSALSMLTQALYVSGGITDIGSLRNIEVRRGGRAVAKFDLYDLMLKGDSQGDTRLMSGDVVFVPTVQRLVTVSGPVRRPGVYEIASDETLGDLLEMAGGIGRRGFMQTARLVRHNIGDSLPVLINLDLTNTDQLHSTLVDGDFIQIDWIASRPRNAISIQGAVARPGVYAWVPGCRISTFIRDLDADLLPFSDLSSGIIVRRRADLFEIDVIGFDPNGVIGDPGSALDPQLRPLDELIFFGVPGVADSDPLSIETDTLTEGGEPGTLDRRELLAPVVARLKAQASPTESAPVINVVGAVRAPGEYPLLKGRKLWDVLDLAGGLEDDAFLENIEVLRVESTDGQSAATRIINLSLLGSAPQARSFTLASRDAVIINRIPNWTPSDSIELSGKVVFPGTYLIRNGETLGSVIKRAGGIAQDGFVEGAVFTRPSVKELEDRQLRSLVNAIARHRAARVLTSEAAQEGSQRFNTSGAGMDNDDSALTRSILTIETEGRLLIRLEQIVKGDLAADVELQGGDALWVPPRTNSIAVVGEVNRPGSFHYEGGVRIRDYIELAAGLTDRADAKSIYLVRANGEVVVNLYALKRRFTSFRSVSRIKEGDTIVVPINQGYALPLDKYRQLSSVVFQTLASVAALMSL